jgi:hypothetical protein
MSKGLRVYLLTQFTILLWLMFILGEEAVMSKIFDQGTASVIPALKEYYGINFNVPLDTEIKMGYDWLNMKEINNA